MECKQSLENNISKTEKWIIAGLKRLMNWFKSLSLDAVEHIFLTLLKIGVYLFLIILVSSVFWWTYVDKEVGIVIQPFEITGIDKESLSGTSLAYLLSSDLQQIKEIDRLKQKQIPFSLLKKEFGVSTVIEAQARSIMKPKPYVEIPLISVPFNSNALNYQLSKMGTIGIEQTSLSVGQIILFSKELSKNRADTIASNLQRYGRVISMVAIYYNQSQEPLFFEVRQTLTEINSSIDEQISLMVNDLAFQIAHKLVNQKRLLDENYPSTWQAFKYMILGKKAYFSYIATSDINELDKAKDFALLANHYESTYQEPLELLSNLGFAYLLRNNNDDLKKAESIFKNIAYNKPFESALGTRIRLYPTGSI